jgi:hypothetical protein
MPYKLGFSGKLVLSLKYWSSKIRLAADVLNSVSLFSLRETANVNGLFVQENSRSELSGLTLALAGRGQTDSWIWKTCSAWSEILTCRRCSVVHQYSANKWTSRDPPV